MFEVLHTERLILRPFVKTDAPRVVEILGDYEVSKWLSSVPHPFTRQDLKIFDPDTTRVWPDFMAVEHDGQVLGAMNNRPKLGYWFAPDAHGKGFATEAAMAVCEFVFNTQNRDELESGYYADNPASARVLEKCGFREIRRGQQFSKARKETRAHVWVSLSRERWRARA